MANKQRSAARERLPGFRCLRTGTPGVMAAILLAACSGNTESPEAAMQDNPAGTSAVAGSTQTSAVTVQTREHAQGFTRTVDATSLMDWAERAYAEFFPSHQANGSWPPYTYRYYPETGNYLGVDGNTVQVLGPVSGGQVLTVGVLEDFHCSVFPVDCQPSVLLGRGWTAGQLLESDDNTVKAFKQGLDDTGRAMVVFVKSDGKRNVLYATQGTSNGPNAFPSWSVPTPIDLLADGSAATVANPFYGGYGKIALNVAPNGNAAATWPVAVTCNANTFYSGNPIGSCVAVAMSRFDAASKSWSKATYIAYPSSTVDSSSLFLLTTINARGDYALIYNGWELASNNKDKIPRVAVKAIAAGSQTAKESFIRDTILSDFDLTLDSDGNLLLAGSAKQNSTTDIVAYRGNTATGLGPQELLDSRNAAATYSITKTGSNGQTVLLWTQNNGANTSRYAATLRTAKGPWTVEDIGGNFDEFGGLVVTDDGDAVWFDLTQCAFRRWGTAGWTDVQYLPSKCAYTNTAYGETAFARNGNYLNVNDKGGWISYDQNTNTLVQPLTTTTPGPGFVLGINKTNPGSWNIALSISGVGLFVSAAAFDTLPSATSPAGDGRSSVTNLWGLILR